MLRLRWESPEWLSLFGSFASNLVGVAKNVKRFYGGLTR